MIVLPRAYTTKDSRPFFVRLSTPADAPTIIAAINAVCAEGLWLATDCYVPTPQWEEVLHHPDDAVASLLLVPQMAGEVGGWCRVFPYTSGSKAAHVADIGIGVLQPLRGLGIGTALLECAMDWACQHGFEKLTASSFATNLRALNLFQKMSFARTGIRCRQYRVGGQYVDEILMERFL